MKYTNKFGRWKVTTEGDVEGRTTNDLGVWEGYVDEIALHLADKCYYSLTFKFLEPQPEKLIPVKNKVNIQFDIDSGTWDFSPEGLVKNMKIWFKDRPVQVENCNYYASFTIKSKESLNPEEIKKMKALKKLKKSMSEEELELLGFGNKE